jgi:uncharacterized protein (DUF2062 family)
MAEAKRSGRVPTFFRRRLLEPVLELLRQGVTPEKIALSLAFGLGIGIFPVLGVSTAACTLVAIVLRLNLPAIQLVNYLASPLQLALIIPFVRVGERVMGATPQPLSIEEGFRLMGSGVMHAITVLWDAIVHAALGWILIGPVLIYGLYRAFRPLLVRAAGLKGEVLDRRASRSATTVSPAATARHGAEPARGMVDDGSAP